MYARPVDGTQEVDPREGPLDAAHHADRGGEGLVFVGRTDPRRHRSCLVDADDGSERWSTSTWSGRSEATLGDGLVTAYGFVYVSTADGVVALDAATGAAPSPA